jgi:hypothetical protein
MRKARKTEPEKQSKRREGSAQKDVRRMQAAILARALEKLREPIFPTRH